jgi:hypothetical protein
VGDAPGHEHQISLIEQDPLPALACGRDLEDGAPARQQVDAAKGGRKHSRTRGLQPNTLVARVVKSDLGNGAAQKIHERSVAKQMLDEM